MRCIDFATYRLLYVTVDAHIVKCSWKETRSQQSDLQGLFTGIPESSAALKGRLVHIVFGLNVITDPPQQGTGRPVSNSTITTLSTHKSVRWIMSTPARTLHLLPAQVWMQIVVLPVSAVQGRMHNAHLKWTNSNLLPVYRFYPTQSEEHRGANVLGPIGKLSSLADAYISRTTKLTAHAVR